MGRKWGFPDLKVAGGAPRLPSPTSSPPRTLLSSENLPTPFSCFLFFFFFLSGFPSAGHRSLGTMRSTRGAVPSPPPFYMNVFISVCLELP